jgi:hypothetical protein
MSPGKPQIPPCRMSGGTNQGVPPCAFFRVATESAMPESISTAPRRGEYAMFADLGKQLVQFFFFFPLHRIPKDRG